MPGDAPEPVPAAGDASSTLLACIAGRQVAFWAPIAGWLAILGPGSRVNAQTQLGQAVPMWGTAWSVLVAVLAIELLVFGRVQHQQLDRGRASFALSGLVVACVLVAAPLWWLAGGAVNPSP